MPRDTALPCGAVLTIIEEPGYYEQYVTVPTPFEHVDPRQINDDLLEHGLVLIDADEDEPELLPEGLRIWCQPKDGGGAGW